MKLKKSASIHDKSAPHRRRRVTEIKSVWLVISEAGNAVCGVV